MSPSPDQTHTDAHPGTSSTDAAASAKVVRPAELLEGVLGPVVESMGYELVHTEFSGSGKHRRLSVFLDRPFQATQGGEPPASPGSPQGISLDDCTKMSPIISSSYNVFSSRSEVWFSTIDAQNNTLSWWHSNPPTPSSAPRI